MGKMNRREALKAGAAGMALVASPFAIAQGSVIQNEPELTPEKTRPLFLEKYNDLPRPSMADVVLWSGYWPVAFWIELYNATPDVAKGIKIHWYYDNSRQILIRWNKNWSQKFEVAPFEIATSAAEVSKNKGSFGDGEDITFGRHADGYEQRMTCLETNCYNTLSGKHRPLSMQLICLNNNQNNTLASITVLTYEELFFRVNELDADDAVFGAEGPRHFVSIPPKKV